MEFIISEKREKRKKCTIIISSDEDWKEVVVRIVEASIKSKISKIPKGPNAPRWIREEEIMTEGFKEEILKQAKRNNVSIERHGGFVISLKMSRSPYNDHEWGIDMDKWKKRFSGSDCNDENVIDDLRSVLLMVGTEKIEPKRDYRKTGKIGDMVVNDEESAKRFLDGLFKS